MKLGKLTIPGPEKRMLSGEIRTNNYIAADTLPGEYTDITSIENWDTYGLLVVNDFLAVREEINKVFIGTTWSALSATERDIIIKYYLHLDQGAGVENTEKVTHLITTGQAADVAEASSILIKKWNIFNEKNKADLTSRWVYCKLVIATYFNMADAEDLFDTVKILLSDMLLVGRLGIGYGLNMDNENGIMNYIMSDQQYAGTGMEFDGYTLLTGTWTDVKTELENILIKGIYNKSDLDG